MSTSNFSASKRVALAASGMAYMFAAPYVVAWGPIFVALWIVIGVSLAYRMVLAIAPVGFRSPFARHIEMKRDRRIAETPGRIAPVGSPVAA
jgi:hypothetical protein